VRGCGVFVGTTALTLAVWFTDPGYRDSNPVVDLGFFALGAKIAIGIGMQLRGTDVQAALTIDTVEGATYLHPGRWVRRRCALR
jgi:hypothetical protein